MSIEKVNFMKKGKITLNKIADGTELQCDPDEVGSENSSGRMSEYFGIQWAPRDIPMSRRLQTLAVTAWICFVLFGEAVAIFLFIKLLYSSWWWIGLLYGAWMIYDSDIANKGGRKFEWVRNWSWWNYYRDYFPINMVKTTDLDRDKNYIFACFPHGVVCNGAFGAFATNAVGFPKLFPGMTAHLITLSGHFMIPFFRDLLLGAGSCASSPESLNFLLNPKRQKGRCVILLVGGAAEALESHPGEYKVTLSKRKGFIRIAIQNGASLVPVFSFGETDVFRPMNNPKDGFLRRCQEKIRVWTGISPIFPVGRGIFQYTFGVVPLRTPITTVVGEPIEVVRNLDPTEVEVNAVHAQFQKSLEDLFDQEKSKYIDDYENAKLVIT